MSSLPPLNPDPLDTPPPNPARVGAPRGLVGQAARYAVFSALWVLLVGYVSMALPPGGVGRIVTVTLCLLLIISGLLAGILALVRNRTRRQPGVRGYATVGVLIHGVYLVLIGMRAWAFIAGGEA